MVASVVLPTPGGPNRMMELGAVSEPLEAGLARRRNGDPCPSTWLCPTTSSRVCGRIRTANGLVMSSGASEAPNKSFSLIPLTLPRSRRAPGTIVYCAKPPPTPQCCRQPIGAICHVWQYAIVIATVPPKNDDCYAAPLRWVPVAISARRLTWLTRTRRRGSPRIPTRKEH